MRFIHCALPAEARSLIDFYRLKQVVQKPFRVYQNENVVLIVSGVGKENTATALGFLGGHYDTTKSTWLNVGVCGSSDAEVGKIFLINKCVDSSSGYVHYPPQLVDPLFGFSVLHTVDFPEQAFLNNGVYDMEASAFFRAATRFTTSELVQSIKIVSDNTQTGFKDVDKHMVIDLVGSHVDEVNDFNSKLFQFVENENGIEEKVAVWQRDIADQWRFSTTQRIQLSGVLNRIALLSKDEFDLSIVRNANNSREVLMVLSNFVDTLPVRF